MPGRVVCRIFILSVLFAISVHGAEQGLVIEEATLTTRNGRDKASTKIIYCTRSAVSVVDSSSSVKVLFKIPEKKVYLIDDRRRSYEVTTIDALEKRLRDLMPKRQLTRHTVKATGRTKMVLGYRCDGYTLSVPQNAGRTTVWISGRLDIPETVLAPLLTLSGTPLDNNGLGEILRERRGYIMESETTTRITPAKSDLKVHTIVTRLKSLPIPEKILMIPSEYRERKGADRQ